MEDAWPEGRKPVFGFGSNSVRQLRGRPSAVFCFKGLSLCSPLKSFWSLPILVTFWEEWGFCEVRSTWSRFTSETTLSLDLMPDQVAWEMRTSWDIQPGFVVRSWPSVSWHTSGSSGEAFLCICVGETGSCAPKLWFSITVEHDAGTSMLQLLFAHATQGGPNRSWAYDKLRCVGTATWLGEPNYLVKWIWLRIIDPPKWMIGLSETSKFDQSC